MRISLKAVAIVIFNIILGFFAYWAIPEVRNTPEGVMPDGLAVLICVAFGTNLFALLVIGVSWIFNGKDSYITIPLPNFKKKIAPARVVSKRD